MKKSLFFLIALVGSIQVVHSQASQIEKEHWVDKPVIHSLGDKYSKESAVIISEKRTVEFTDEGKQEVAEYYTLHKIIHINDDRGIEGFNKIYLGISENSDIVDVKARTILPGGRIIELDKSNIKDLKEKDGNIYKIFAMDGLEKGSEIEYFYTFKKPTTFFGREVLQESVPVLETSFRLIGPPRLRFELKPYNFSVPVTDTVLNNKRVNQCYLKETAGVEDEKYAFYDANLDRLEYKLCYNESGNKDERLFTWNELAKRVYSVYSFHTDKENKEILSIIKENGWENGADEEAKIIAIESYIKKNYSYDEHLVSDEGNVLDHVIKNKIGGTIGLVRLYSTILLNTGINCQIVLTGDREKFIIDKQFENWNNCDFPVLFFPAENKYLAPTRPDYRYPWIYPSEGGTNGLFCRATTLGTYTAAIGEVRPILLEDYTKSYDNINSRLELNRDLDSLTIDEKQSFAGYAAISYRDAFNFSNDEQKRNIIKELTKMFQSTDNILSSEILNQGFENETSNVPLTLHVKTKSGELIERAGNKLLLKIGMAIGPQVEMYQEKPRQEPVDMSFGHVEERRIDFVIPEGYKINNLNDLKIDQTFKESGELTMGFVSDYEVKGNILSIHIIEQYRKTFYPLSQFDQFRKVINASSDFNKVTLVLEKVKT